MWGSFRAKNNKTHRTRGNARLYVITCDGSNHIWTLRWFLSPHMTLRGVCGWPSPPLWTFSGPFHLRCRLSPRHWSVRRSGIRPRLSVAPSFLPRASVSTLLQVVYYMDHGRKSICWQMLCPGTLGEACSCLCVCFKNGPHKRWTAL